MDADADMDPLTTDENIDERIARWHEGGDYSQPLHEYLGLTMEQYGHWVETGTLGRCPACGGQGWHAQFPANGDPPEQIQCEQCWGTGIT